MCVFLNSQKYNTYFCLSITPNKLEVSAEPSKSADRELSVESGFIEDMKSKSC